MPETLPAPVQNGAGTVTAASENGQQQMAGLESGVALVYVSEDLAGELEKGNQRSAEWKLLTRKLSVSSATRLFPDAGEFEPRTRAEGLHRWYVLHYDKEVETTSARRLIEAVPGVQRMEPGRRIRCCVTPNDTYWNRMWGMNNTTYPGFDVNCKPVWDTYTMGNSSVTVAVVDGGFQLTHPDLAANVATSGHYNYVDDNSTILQHFHGTHVAGTIAAVNNNGTGVTGIAGGNFAAGKAGVKLLSLQVFKTLDNGQTASAYDFSRALKEAADRGAIISQNSWGHYFDFNDDGQITGYELTYARQAHENPERSFTQAVDYFNKYAGCDNNGNQLSTSPMKGGVVIFAAGNEDIPYGSPGNYDGCVSVGAINRNGSRASFTNYGDWVDVCAPGVDVYSTYLSGQYTYMSGTSMACPHASGVAALIVSYFGGQGFTADELRARLIGGAKTIGATSGSKPIGPLVDAWGAFQMNSGGKAPEQVTDPVVNPTGHNLRVDFTSTGAYAYIVVAGKTKRAVENANYFDPAPDLVTATKIASSTDIEGTPLSVQLAGLAPEQQYYVAVVAYSYDRKCAPLSEITQMSTGKNQKPVIEIPDYPAEGFVFAHHSIITLPVRFSDPDGDAMSVNFQTKGRASLDPNNGSQEYYNFKLMCPLSTPGEYTANVDVTDEVGAKTRGSILYTVLPNTPPQMVKDPGTLLLEDTTRPGDLTLTDYFSDPDGEDLFFRVTSLDTKVATVALTEDGKLAVTPVSQGVCKVKISAEDHESERVEGYLTVLVRPKGAPEVFVPGNTILTGGDLTVILGLEEAQTRVRLISASGVIVYSEEGNFSAATPVEIDMDRIAPGIYTLEVIYKEQTYTYTIVKR